MGELKASLKDKCEADTLRVLFPLTRAECILFKYLETLSASCFKSTKDKVECVS